MAVSGFGAVSKTAFPLRSPIVLCARHARRRASATVALEPLAAPDFLADAGRPDATSPPPPPPPTTAPRQVREGPLWKVMNSKNLGIKNSMITKPARTVLNELRKKGYDVYLVGGCVRDLIMNKTPKDFDIITSADLRQVQKTFQWCDIIGKRFPICHVHVNDFIVEVSSFHTCGRKSNSNLAYIPKRPSNCKEDDYIRWKNCLARDFTINGLMFNPYSNLIYDYLGGMEDIKKAKIRTVNPAHTSFQQDCARILRAIRIAARLGFRFSKNTAISVRDLSGSVLRLDKGRLLMEMNYMLAYGSAEASLRLLWKFGILELLLPIQAAYFVSQGFRRRDDRFNMLLALFSNLDMLLAPNRPCHSSLWVGILAFHQALVLKHRDPLVISTFTLALHNGGDLSEAVSIARGITHQHDASFSELLEPGNWDSDEDLLSEVQDLANFVDDALSLMTSAGYVSQAMAKYPRAPSSDMVFIPLQVYARARTIFECVGGGDREKGFVPKQGSKINYSSLARGNLTEARHVFARVVFDTVYPPNRKAQRCNSPA